MYKHVGYFIMQLIYTPLYRYPLASYGPRGGEMCLDGNNRKKLHEVLGVVPRWLGGKRQSPDDLKQG